MRINLHNAPREEKKDLHEFIIQPEKSYCFLKSVPLGIIGIMALFLSFVFPTFQGVLLLGFVIISSIVIYNYFLLRSYTYEISKERIKLKKGIIGKKIYYLELYRVQDITVAQPFVLQLIGAMNLILKTTDRSHPVFVFSGIAYSDERAEKFRNLIEEVRKIRVHEVD